MKLLTQLTNGFNLKNTM